MNFMESMLCVNQNYQDVRPSSEWSHGLIQPPQLRGATWQSLPANSTCYRAASAHLLTSSARKAPPPPVINHSLKVPGTSAANQLNRNDLLPCPPVHSLLADVASQFSLCVHLPDMNSHIRYIDAWSKHVHRRVKCQILWCPDGLLWFTQPTHLVLSYMWQKSTILESQSVI